MKFSGYYQDINYLNKKMHVDIVFDLKKRSFYISKNKATMYFVDGFVDSETTTKIMQGLLSVTRKELIKAKNLKQIGEKFIPFAVVNELNDLEEVQTKILSGGFVLFVEGFLGALEVEVKKYPQRQVEEPANNRVLRGSRDGFIENIVSNLALLRRRIRDTDLIVEHFTKGDVSKTDIVICYHKKCANEEHIKIIREKIEKANVPSYCMSQESLVEAIIDKKWYNPFPKVRYTDRPDVASANLIEGKIIVMVDNSSAAIIIPTSFFDFFQDINDYYFPPATGNYLRLIRFLTSFSTLFLTPIWYYLMKNQSLIPEWLSFIKIGNNNGVPILFQLLVMEIILDGMQIASLNTPDSLGSSMSVIAGLLLGDFAVKSGWFVSEVILYMSFVSISSFTQISFEMNYASKFMRIMLLILISMFNTYGFILGILIIFLLLLTNKSIYSTSYLYPLIPFDKNKLIAVFERVREEEKIKNNLS